MQKNDYSLAFSLFSGIGPKRFDNLIKKAGNLQRAWESASAKLFADAEISKKVYIDFEDFKKTFDPEKYSKRLQALGVIFLNRDNKYYPKRLRKIDNPPIGIFAKGNINVLKSDQTIAVVGTRKMTSYGHIVTEQLVTELVNDGYVIVSGLAMGVDRVAHEACIASMGKTIAVLGNGVDTCFPRENERTYKGILESSGVIISEYPPGAQASKGSFPARNRIIAGISLGVLVTEAGGNSGSLITAELARKQKKSIFAVPGPITSNMSRGPIELLKKGAHVVESAEDIIAILQSESTTVTKKKKKVFKNKNLNREEKIVIKILQKEEATIDELSKNTKISIQSLSQILSEFELEGIIVSGNDGVYRML